MSKRAAACQEGSAHGNGTCWRLDHGRPASGSARSRCLSLKPRVPGVFCSAARADPPNPTSRTGPQGAEDAPGKGACVRGSIAHRSPLPALSRPDGPSAGSQTLPKVWGGPSQGVGSTRQRCGPTASADGAPRGLPVGISALPGSVRPQRPRPCGHVLGEGPAVAAFPGNREGPEAGAPEPWGLAHGTGSQLPQTQRGPDPGAWTPHVAASLAGLGGDASPRRGLFNIPGQGWSGNTLSQRASAMTGKEPGRVTRFLPQGLCPPHAAPLPCWNALFPGLPCALGLGFGVSAQGGHPRPPGLTCPPAQSVLTVFHVMCYFPHGVSAPPTPSGRVFVNWPLPHPTASRPSPACPALPRGPMAGARWRGGWQPSQRAGGGRTGRRGTWDKAGTLASSTLNRSCDVLRGSAAGGDRQGSRCSWPSPVEPMGPIALPRPRGGPPSAAPDVRQAPFPGFGRFWPTDLVDTLGAW